MPGKKGKNDQRILQAMKINHRNSHYEPKICNVNGSFTQNGVFDESLSRFNSLLIRLQIRIQPRLGLTNQNRGQINNLDFSHEGRLLPADVPAD